MAKPEILSHWHHGIDGLTTSSEEFYTAIENNIKQRKFPDVKFHRKKLSEGGMLSSKRIYLRIEWKEFRFDIGAAPFGTTYFFSSWLTTKKRFVEPGGIFDPETFYRVDAGIAFQEIVNGCVADAVDDVSKAKGLRLLSEAERKPTMRNLFQ